MQFPERHPGTRIVKLERNYRSKKPILDLANASIAHNPEQFPKTLRATRDGAASAPKVIEIVEENLDSGYRPGDIAILYRAHFNAVDVQLALARAGVRYSITSGTGFYELSHVKDVVSLLRVAEGMDDPLAFSRVLRLLPAVGEATAEKIVRKFGGAVDSGDEAALVAIGDALPPRARASWGRLAAALAIYPRMAFPERVKTLVEAFLDAFYRERLRKDYENADDRENDIRELLADIAGHESVRSFLSDVALLTNLDREAASKAGKGGDGGGTVLLSTIHQAKGLEWPVVIVLWLSEGVFPSSRAIDDQGGDDEERRLFYVAVTRARDRLWLMQPCLRTTPDGGRFHVEKSRFLREIPQSLYELECAGGVSSFERGWGGGSPPGGRAAWALPGRDEWKPGGIRLHGVKIDLPF